VDARVVNTTSSSGIYGNVGQTNYGAAKAGIAAFTVILAKEVERYGVLVNAIAPGALTRLTEDLVPDRPPLQDGYDPRSPAEVAPLVGWLASSACAVTGRVFNVRGGEISVAEGWVAGPVATTDRPWTAEAVGELVPDLVARAAPNAAMNGRRLAP
jgi:NAD(P)-dependent dehydrogenase (short-subunit alcohol dehydrogenase family)